MIKHLSNSRLAYLKRQARKIGFIAESSDMFERFYHEANLHYVFEYGKVMEIIIAFVLGAIQNRLTEKGIRFWVGMDATDDSIQIDFRLNAGLIQLKFGWSDVDVEAMQDVLRFRGIKVINIKKYDPDVDYDIIDSIADMLREAGLNEKEIAAEIDDDPALDLAEQVWVWYCTKII